MLSETKLNVLKQISGDLSRDEAIWASGYLAGLAGGTTLTASLPPLQVESTVQNTVKKITLAYGTETGNSKKLATGLAGIVKKKGIQVKLADLSQYKPKDLAKEEFFFIIISTQGEGEPPILAKKFYDHIHENEIDLTNVKFGVLALGDSSYPQFCKTGEDVDSRFEILGAQRIIPLKKCDIDYEEEAHQWIEHVFETVNTNPGSTKNASTPKASTGRKKYQGKISTIINLNDITSEKETYHIEIETEEALVYQPGAALGVIPFNSRSVVEEIIALTGIDPGKQIETAKVTDTVEKLLHKHLNISYLLKTVVAQYAKITGHSIPEVRLSLLDLLRIYPVKNEEEFGEVIQILTGQAPRLYSISSSLEAHGESEIHITVAKSEFFIDHQKHNGLCSGFLSEFTEGEDIEFYIQNAGHFKLPEQDKDIIMIGPGTGIAPFRSFLWERDALGAEGRNWLFFGDRNFVSDFLYQSELQDFLKTGSLTHLDLAFSRDTAEKIYVQHKLEQSAQEVFYWLEGGASVYICGAKEPMSRDVEETLLHIIQNQGKRSREEAIHYLEDMELNGRYAKDVY